MVSFSFHFMMTFFHFIGKPMTIVYPHVPQITNLLENPAAPNPATPMTQSTAASLEIPGQYYCLVP
jgi:hypothetical protein